MILSASIFQVSNMTHLKRAQYSDCTECLSSENQGLWGVWGWAPENWGTCDHWSLVSWPNATSLDFCKRKSFTVQDQSYSGMKLLSGTSGHLTFNFHWKRSGNRHLSDMSGNLKQASSAALPVVKTGRIFPGHCQLKTCTSVRNFITAVAQGNMKRLWSCTA